VKSLWTSCGGGDVLPVIEVRSDVRAEHLTDEDISGYLDGDASADQRHRIEAHIESCAECRAALVDVMRAVDSAPSAERPIPTTNDDSGKTRGRPGWITGSIGVAAAAGIVALMFFRSDGAATRRESQRAPAVSAADARPRIVVLAPAENSSLDRERVSFAWRGTGADAYKVFVTTQAGDPVWTGTTADTTIALPADILLRRGTMYFWHVDAVTSGISASSVSRAFTIR